VGQERRIAQRVVERLQGEFSGFFLLETILWEHEPLRATSHFQEQILPPSQADIVVCILWSRLGTRLPEQFHREDGSRYASGTEWEFEDALRSYKERGAPDLMVYRKVAEYPANFKDDEAVRQWLHQKTALEKFIDRWFGNPKESFKAAFHAFPSPEQFEEILENHLRRLIRDRVPKYVPDDDGASQQITWYKGSPYRGLEAFDVEHAPVFFGRTQAIGAIKDALLKQDQNGCAFVLVFGMSGSGKSSLARAGVLPTLTHPGVVEGIGDWRWSIFRPGEAAGDLLHGLAQAIRAESALPNLPLDAAQLAAAFRETPEKAAEAVRSALGSHAEEVAAAENLAQVPVAKLFLLVDQMEELFARGADDPKRREEFVAALSLLARSGAVWALGTMRSDFYGRCGELPELVRLKKGWGTYDLLPPTFAEIDRIIRFPTRAAGLRFEANPKTGERLKDILHEAAASQPESLPLLEFTLEELFKERTDEGTLTLDSYRKMGGMEGALARRAEDLFESLPSEVQSTLPSVFRAMVAVGPGDGDAATARQASLSEVTAQTGAKAFTEAFIASRLFVTDRDSDGNPVVRIAHEALLRRWPRLQSWLAEDREFLRIRDRVAEDASRWKGEGLREDFLLRPGKPLAEAEELVFRRRDDLDPGLAEYIEASRNHAVRQRKRRSRIIGVSVGAFCLIVTGFGLFSFFQWKRADRQKELALTAIGKFTYDIPQRLSAIQGAAPILKTIYEENESLLNEIGGSYAEREQGVSLNRAGDMWLQLGNPKKALEKYRAARALRRKLAADPQNREAQRDLSISDERIGDVNRNMGDINGAVSAYRESLGIRERLARLHRTDVAVRDLSVSYERMGDVLQGKGDLAGAQDAYEKSLSLARELARNPKNATARNDLVMALYKVGLFDLRAKQPQKAIAAATEGLGLQPGHPLMNALLAHGYLFSGQFDTANALYLMNENAPVSGKLKFKGLVLSDFQRFRAMGLDRPEMRKIEAEFAAKKSP
jgi:tetratricopeptide (TPR) repeat protein